MRLPACQILWMLVILVGLILLVTAVLIIAAMLKRSVRSAAWISTLIAFALLTCLFWTRTAVYSGQPAPGDTAIGLPLIYAYGQSDAGLGPFFIMRLLFDVIFGLGMAAILIVVDAGLRKLKAQQRAPSNPHSPPAQGSDGR